MAASTTCFDLSDWSVVALNGPDRKSYLHSFCTNDINKLTDGGVCEAFVPNEKGRILGHVFVCSEADELMLFSVPGVNKILVPHLTKYLLGVEADVSDRSLETGLLCLVGENTHQVLGLETALDLNQSAAVNIEQQACVALRVDLTNSPTYLVYGSRLQIETLKKSLLSKEILSGTFDDFNRLRIEAGFPFSGQDVTEANIAQEAARTERAISFTKGCYLGQEPIARLDAMGHTNKELRGFLIESDQVSPGAKILFEEKEVGQITSVAQASAGTSVALGIIRIKQANPGQTVAIVTDAGTFPAEVYWPRLTKETP